MELDGLDDYSHLQVLEHFTLAKLMIFRRVSTRWQRLIEKHIFCAANCFGFRFEYSLEKWYLCFYSCHPLSIGSPEKNTIIRTTVYSDVFNLITRLFPNVKKLQVEHPDLCYASFNLIDYLEKWTNLENLELSLQSETAETQQRFWQALYSLKSLKQLKITFSFRYWTIPYELLVLANLEELSLSQLTSLNITLLLQQLGPKLQKLSFDFVPFSFYQFCQSLSGNPNLGRCLTHLELTNFNSNSYFNENLVKVYFSIFENLSALCYLKIGIEYNVSLKKMCLIFVH